MRQILSLVVLGLTVAMAGCAADASEEEPTGGSADALSEASAYQKVIAAGIFKTGHLACGRSLSLTASHGSEGSFEYDVVPCEGDGTTESHTEGHFEVRGGWLGGLLTNPRLILTPSNPPEVEEPWSFEISVNEEVVRLTDAQGTLIPEAMLD